jgi:NDP-sugar pyrophosphorylase family protein
LEPSGGEQAIEAGEPGVSGPVLVAEGCRIDPMARLDGPLVIGRESTVGAGARVKESVVLPGADVPEGALVAGAVYGRRA